MLTSIFIIKKHINIINNIRNKFDHGVIFVPWIKFITYIINYVNMLFNYKYAC